MDVLSRAIMEVLKDVRTIEPSNIRSKIKNYKNKKNKKIESNAKEL